MKILWGLSTTGNGHVARAQAILPELKKYADVDFLLSGPGYGLKIDGNIKYRKKGYTFSISDEGKVEIANTILKNDTKKFLKDVGSLDIEEYDLIVTDFDPITAWAAKLKGKPLIAFGNQYAYLSKEFKKDTKLNPLHSASIRVFADGDKRIAVDYEATEDWIYTPLIRKEILDATPTEGSHVTTYLVGYSIDFLLETLHKIPEVTFELFHKDIKNSSENKNVRLRKVDREGFTKSLINCKGYISRAGFTSTAEAISLGKKILIIPINHFEQAHNADTLEKMGAKRVKEIDNKFPEEVRKWLDTGKVIKRDYKDVAPDIAKEIYEYAKSHSVKM